MSWRQSFIVGGCIHSEGECRLLVQAGKKVLTDDHCQHHYSDNAEHRSTHMVADIIHQTLTILQLINTDHHLLISVCCYSVFTVFIWVDVVITVSRCVGTMITHGRSDSCSTGLTHTLQLSITDPNTWDTLVKPHWSRDTQTIIYQPLVKTFH